MRSMALSNRRRAERLGPAAAEVSPISAGGSRTRPYDDWRAGSSKWGSSRSGNARSRKVARTSSKAGGIRLHSSLPNPLTEHAP